MLAGSQTIVNGPLPLFFKVSEKVSYYNGLIDLGYFIFPLHRLFWIEGNPSCDCHLGTECQSPGKHPSGKWSNPLNPSDPQARRCVQAIIEHWPDRGFGIHIGLSGLIVIDVDPRNGGDTGLEKLSLQMGCDLGKPYCITGGLGKHFYYRAPPNCDPRKGWTGPNGVSSTNVLLAPGVELLSGQHYVVLPYSPHKSGRWYMPTDRPLPIDRN